MAYRRSIIARAKSFYQHQPRLAPSLSHITSSDREEFPTKTTFTNSEICSRFLRNRNNSGNSSLLSGNASRLIGSKIQASYGLILHRNFSNVPSDSEIHYGGGDLVGAAGDKAVEAAAVVNEVAVAAADSFPPVAAFQYLIDYVHCYTGLEWWASIAATTLLIRFIQLPVSIYTLNIWWIYLPEFKKRMPLPFKPSPETLEEITAAVEPKITNKYREIFEAGMYIGCVYPCILFFAIRNMAEKVPSFMTGGTLWFMDLTTPSAALPVLLALTIWLRMGLAARLYLQTTTFSTTNSTALALLLAVASTRLPSAIHCYLITTNLFSIVFSIVMMDPRAQEMVSLKPPSGLNW